MVTEFMRNRRDLSSEFEAWAARDRAAMEFVWMHSRIANATHEVGEFPTLYSPEAATYRPVAIVDMLKAAGVICG